MRPNVFGLGIVDVSAAVINGAQEFTVGQRQFFLDDAGVPIAHPSLLDDHVLLATYVDSTGAKVTMIVYDFMAMIGVHLASGPNAILWRHGNVLGIETPDGD